jgi:hypothetical protein
MNITTGTKTMEGLTPSALMALALDDETQFLELPTKTIVTRTPAEFISFRAAILSDLALDMIKTNPPAPIKEGLVLFAGELGSMAVEVLQFDATSGVN